MPDLIKPPFSYTGCKSRLLAKCLWRYLPTDGRKVVEPFAGSAAFLYNSPVGGVGIDRDRVVVALHNFLWREDAFDWYREVVKRYFPRGARSPEGFLSLRKDFNGLGGSSEESLDDPMQAARLVVLQQLCFNSLLRFNPKGHFNVGYGRKELDPMRVAVASARSRALDLCFVNANFDGFDVEIYPKLPALFYCDPPYLASKYHYGVWSSDDETRLHAWLDGLHARGARFVLTSTTRHRGVDNPQLKAWMSSYDVRHVGGRMRGWSSAVASVARAEDTDEVIVSNFQPCED